MSSTVDGENELSQRCIESISSMGTSPTAFVDASGFSDEAIVNVAAQLQQKGWHVDVTAADGYDAALLVISRSPARTAAPTQLEGEGEKEEDEPSSSQVTPTGSKTKIWVGVAIAAIGALALAWFFYISPRRQLDELAKDTCYALDGEMMLHAARRISKAVDKAEKLGFTGRDLGDRMREHCPSILRQIEEFASRY